MSLEGRCAYCFLGSVEIFCLAGRQASVDFNARSTLKISHLGRNAMFLGLQASFEKGIVYLVRGTKRV